MDIVIKDYMTNELGLSGNELLLYAILSSYHDIIDMPCPLSIKEMARLVNTSERSMYRALEGLKVKGLISKGYYARTTAILRSDIKI